ncbi:hypothetical protein B0H19DRAFT_1224745 [Mycena capillaripes]|nr:hypothetical protein B0H19DRAFT_1224745 [Mycena capillaripes]
MCDAVLNLKSALVFWALTSISGTPWRYVCLAVAFIWSTFLAVRHQGPVQKFSVLEDAIRTTKEILEHAKAAPSGTRHQMELNDAGCRLLQVKFSASMIQSQMLEIHTSTWKTYLQSVRTILCAVDQCASEVKDIQTAILQSQLIIEEERRRKLTEGIQDSQDALNAVFRSPTRKEKNARMKHWWDHPAPNRTGFHLFYLESTLKFRGRTPVPGCLYFLVS